MLQMDLYNTGWSFDLHMNGIRKEIDLAAVKAAANSRFIEFLMTFCVICVSRPLEGHSGSVLSADGAAAPVSADIQTALATRASSCNHQSAAQFFVVMSRPIFLILGLSCRFGGFKSSLFS